MNFCSVGGFSSDYQTLPAETHHEAISNPARCYVETVRGLLTLSKLSSTITSLAISSLTTELVVYKKDGF